MNITPIVLSKLLLDRTSNRCFLTLGQASVVVLVLKIQFESLCLSPLGRIQFDTR